MKNNMIDLNGKIDVFVITNGRSTFNCCIGSVCSQKDVNFELLMIENMNWLDAHLYLLDKCKSRFALRVDDDMLLHPYALKFMWQCVENQSDKIALRGWRLWEPWSDKVCKGIKVYNIAAAKKIGFKLDKLGKIDKPFTRNAEKKGYKTKYSQDVVAIHSCGDYKEHLKYWKMRGESSGPQFEVKKKWAEELIKNFDMSTQEQYELTGKFLKKLNNKRKTEFGRMING